MTNHNPDDYPVLAGAPLAFTTLEAAALGDLFDRMSKDPEITRHFDAMIAGLSPNDNDLIDFIAAHTDPEHPRPTSGYLVSLATFYWELALM